MTDWLRRLAIWATGAALAHVRSDDAAREAIDTLKPEPADMGTREQELERTLRRLLAHWGAAEPWLNAEEKEDYQQAKRVLGDA